MNRTHLLLALTTLLALGALAIGLPPPPSLQPPPARTPSGGVLPPVTAREGVLTLEGKLSGAYVHTGPGEAHALFTVRANTPPTQRRMPVNLALVIDRSGSMRGQKLADARRAARMLVERLEPGDRLALVHYGSDVRVYPSEEVTPRSRERMISFVDSIEDEGATNLSGGLEAGAEALRPHVKDYRVSRIILLSDGEPTEGIVDEAHLGRLAADYQREGIAVSGLGVGEQFNERLMRGLAEQGGGFYGYLQDSERLAEILGRELEQATGTLARGVRLRLELPEGVTSAEALGVAAVPEAGALSIPLYDLSGGQEVRVVVKLTLALAAPSPERPLVSARLDYNDLVADKPVRMGLELGAAVTEDEELVRTHMDPDVGLAVTRALGASQMQAAAEAMKQGDRTRALDMLGNVRRLFGASASALAGEMREVEQSEAAYRDAQDETSVRREALKLHRKSLQSFGQNNSY
ncbi:VWA domain-containing protein [Cystobacter fuscus]|uniref:vWA domain-containing protein n=1 Tax=Cystobacter fuscus TaxID=43 RepID=UPI002B290D7D|nr:VWA domain-containing protein [Cystobacter fuscus]